MEFNLIELSDFFRNFEQNMPDLIINMLYKGVYPIVSKEGVMYKASSCPISSFDFKKSSIIKNKLENYGSSNYVNYVKVGESNNYYFYSSINGEFLGKEEVIQN